MKKAYIFTATAVLLLPYLLQQNPRCNHRQSTTSSCL